MFVKVIMEMTYVELIIYLLLEKYKNAQELNLLLKSVKLLNKLMIVGITLMLLLNVEDLVIQLVLVKKKLVQVLEQLLLVN